MYSFSLKVASRYSSTGFDSTEIDLIQLYPILDEKQYAMGNITDRVTKIIKEQLGVKEDEITPDAHLVDDLGADSLDTVELVMALEEEFGFEMPDEDAERIRTVQDAIAYIEKKLGKST